MVEKVITEMKAESWGKTMQINVTVSREMGGMIELQKLFPNRESI